MAARTSASVIKRCVLSAKRDPPWRALVELCEHGLEKRASFRWDMLCRADLNLQARSARTWTGEQSRLVQAFPT